MRKTETFLTLVVVCVCLGFTGCGGFSGTWEAGNGAASVTLKSGKAQLSMLGQSEEFPYDIKGNQIIVHTKMGDIEFTHNSDGSLTGPAGKMNKK